MDFFEDLNFLCLIVIFIGTITFMTYNLLQAKKTIASLKKSVSESDLREFHDGYRRSAYLVDECSEMKIEDVKIDPSYEVTRENLVVDEDAILGSGEFGIVYKGKLLIEECWRDVAVKTTKVSTSSLQLKNILIELKLLAYVGEHPNIANLLGCYHHEGKGPIFIAVEFCGMGSLERYLRESCFVNAENVVEQFNDSFDIKDQHRLNLHQFNLWFFQIARGMHYLTKKKIIHSDLATRNILLSDTLNVRITDFGLSRRLYDNIVYIKKTQEPLPWRWMAFESLRNRVYTSQSDVWSFGVTLWEIFSLGEVPYPGLSWSYTFLKYLESGEQLEKPENCPDEIYAKMKCCWNLDAIMRPTFKELEDFFGRIVAGKSEVENIEEYVRRLPYNRNYEIPLENIEMQAALGPGRFGTVYYGKISKPSVWEDATIKPILSTCHNFEDVLLNLKLMIYAGHHPNVIRLLGACTEKVREGTLYITTEFCVRGNLEKYLTDSVYCEDLTTFEMASKMEETNSSKTKSKFLRFLFQKKLNREKQNESKVHFVSKTLMDNWALQIAEGMNFLSAKKIIHGCLVARNVYISVDMTLRISNYGLSLFLHQPTTFLPSIMSWRYMSPEAMRDGVVSTASDVWSYSLTLCQLYSKGQRPYLERAWDVHFAETLKAGIRSKRPKYVSDTIFRMIQKCWSHEPADRPSFEQIVNCFKEIHKQRKEGIIYVSDLSTKE